MTFRALPTGSHVPDYDFKLDITGLEYALETTNLHKENWQHQGSTAVVKDL